MAVTKIARRRHSCTLVRLSLTSSLSLTTAFVATSADDAASKWTGSVSSALARPSREVPGAVWGHVPLYEQSSLSLCPLQEELVARHSKRVDVLEAARRLSPGLIIEHPR